jgi:outer membrane biosynthesis protein TonB
MFFYQQPDKATQEVIKAEAKAAKERGESPPRKPVMGGVNLSLSRKVERVVVHSHGRVLSLETGNMQPAIRELNACTMDLVAQWGLDPAQHRYYTPPRWLNASAISRWTGSDYSDVGPSQTDEGVFRIRVIVETDGRISECTVLRATAANSLKPRVCLRMQEARFEPALDAEGKPMRSFFATSLIYLQ